MAGVHLCTMDCLTEPRGAGPMTEGVPCWAVPWLSTSYTVQVATCVPLISAQLILYHDGGWGRIGTSTHAVTTHSSYNLALSRSLLYGLVHAYTPDVLTPCTCTCTCPSHNCNDSEFYTLA